MNSRRLIPILMALATVFWLLLAVLPFGIAGGVLWDGPSPDTEDRPAAKSDGSAAPFFFWLLTIPYAVFMVGAGLTLYLEIVEGREKSQRHRPFPSKTVSSEWTSVNWSALARRRQRPWYQFRLRTLLLALVAVQVALSVALTLHRSRDASLRKAHTVLATQERSALDKLDPFYSRITYSEEPWISGGVSGGHNQFEMNHTPGDGPNDLDGLFGGVKGDDIVMHVVALRGFDSGFGDAELAHLEALSELEHLDLTGTAVTDAGLEHLKSLRSLREVSLFHTQVTEGGVAVLRESLPDCTIQWR